MERIANGSKRDSRLRRAERDGTCTPVDSGQLTRRETAELLEVSESMVRKMERHGHLHPERDARGRVRYRLHEVQAVQARRASGTGPGASEGTTSPTPANAPETGAIGEDDAIAETAANVPSVSTDDAPPAAIAALLAADAEIVAAWRAVELARAAAAEATANWERRRHDAYLETERAAAAERTRAERIAAIVRRTAAGHGGLERDLIVLGVLDALENVDAMVLEDESVVDGLIKPVVSATAVRHRAAQAIAGQKRLREAIVAEVRGGLAWSGWPAPMIDHAVRSVHADLATLDPRVMLGADWLRHRARLVAGWALGVPTTTPSVA